MNIDKLIEKLKANYPVGGHPNEVREKDFRRTLKNMGFSSDQLDRLYNKILESCDFFPKVYDLHQAVNTLGLERQNATPIANTQKMLEGFKGHEEGAITFKEWLDTGGYEQIWEDCGYDRDKYFKRLRFMGVAVTPDYKMEPKPKELKAEVEFLTECLPEFGFEDNNRPVSLDEL